MVGKPAGARGFPCCSAGVEHPAQGYRAMFGWVQLVRSTDSPSNGTAFEMDPFLLFEDAPSPYAFFGVKPMLFDAPSRGERSPLAWLAHCFLARTPLEDTERHVVPLTGFSWGFDIDDTGLITLRSARALAPGDWDTHRPLLQRRHPGWSFSQWQLPERPDPFLRQARSADGGRRSGPAGGGTGVGPLPGGPRVTPGG
ncbi:hypothetical protein J8N05_46570 (plasmid) [Streptomyces sp. BH-SS-21]|uniref:Uncharacterized protein n=1 Tax=Streptomyces liliiviolaceus TaxID=2823109 RepID=A0A941BJ53_9ACTN|nr:hypothetical protein [Streptomyces liliiviolaceus]MBQ0855629.1 hypothetical protein [Streptomyces liliiviolaceus]